MDLLVIGYGVYLNIRVHVWGYSSIKFIFTTAGLLLSIHVFCSFIKHIMGFLFPSEQTESLNAIWMNHWNISSCFLLLKALLLVNTSQVLRCHALLCLDKRKKTYNDKCIKIVTSISKTSRNQIKIKENSYNYVKFKKRRISCDT